MLDGYVLLADLDMPSKRGLRTGLNGTRGDYICLISKNLRLESRRRVGLVKSVIFRDYIRNMCAKTAITLWDNTETETGIWTVSQDVLDSLVINGALINQAVDRLSNFTARINSLLPRTHGLEIAYRDNYYHAVKGNIMR